jgi:hypothetical protein
MGEGHHKGQEEQAAARIMSQQRHEYGEIKAHHGAGAKTRVRTYSSRGKSAR